MLVKGIYSQPVFNIGGMIIIFIDGFSEDLNLCLKFYHAAVFLKKRARRWRYGMLMNKHHLRFPGKLTRSIPA